MDSLPSPYDPIHHRGRQLDALKLALTESNGNPSTDRDMPSTGSLSAKTDGPGALAGQTPAPGSMPSTPNTISARRLGSLSLAMENGLVLDSTADAKTLPLHSPSAALDASGIANPPVDEAHSGIRLPSRSHAYSWAGLNGPLLPLQLPTAVQMQLQLQAQTQAAASAAAANQPNTPRHTLTHGTVTPIHEEQSSSVAATAVPVSAPLAHRSLPSVEEVARSVIQQLALSSPRSQLGFLGLGLANPQGSAQQPQQPHTLAQNQPTAASAPASHDCAMPDARFAQPYANTAAPAPAPVSTPAASALTPLDSRSSGGFGAGCADGSSGRLANESNVAQSVLSDDPSHGVSSSVSMDKNVEQLLDQQLLSSQKVPIYRHRLAEDAVAVEANAVSSGYLCRLFGLHGHVAIVTGAARGIGLALARGLAMAGARVCLADLNFEQVARESAALNEDLKQPDATFPLRVDVTKRDSIVQLFTSTVERYGQLSICVNNAGLAISGEDPKRNYSESFSEEDFDLTINLNLKAVFFCCQFAARWMIANSVQGSIINVASMSAKVVNWPQRQSVYNASKAAVVQLTKCLAVEWCSYGIRVNSISPGYIDTPLNRQISIAHLRHEWTKKTPQHRLGDPRDLVAAVIYLASNRAAAFTTGEDIVVDGGYTLW